MKRLTLSIAALVVLIGVGQAATIEMVSVGNPGNTADTTGYGSVAYEYLIGKHEVTNAQYGEFLNAVATIADPNGLYDVNMGGGQFDIGGISRSGSGTAGDPWGYSVRPNRSKRPANYPSWYSALRFANWLHNGQPTGGQTSDTTEDGAYDMALGSSVVRKPGATFFLPSENEWYKAAYYKAGGTNAGYWEYPTQSDTAPTSEAPPGTDLVNGSANYFPLGGDYVDTTYYTTEVGAYDTMNAGQYVSDSAYGTFDQAGNLWEWNEDLFVAFQTSRVMRGGGYDAVWPIVAASTFRVGLDPEVSNWSLGFRVAAIPEPSTAVLGISGFLCGLLWWRRRGRA